jgi:hypothetical protein
MKLIIEGTEEEIKQCLEKLAGEKVTIERPTYWIYPPTPDPCSPVFVYPTWVHPNDWSPPPPITTCVSSSIQQAWNTPEEDKAWENL